MKRSVRTRILIDGDPNLAKQLAEEIIAKYEYMEIIEPHYGLTMVKVRESAQNSLFHIGEVFITECKVEVADHVDTGIVVGMEDALAKHLAVIDAAYAAGLPETQQWNEKLQQAKQKIDDAKGKKHAELLQTKVNFETMEV